jgi:hypothetical protein
LRPFLAGPYTPATPGGDRLWQGGLPQPYRWEIQVKFFLTGEKMLRYIPRIPLSPRLLIAAALTLALVLMLVFPYPYAKLARYTYGQGYVVPIEPVPSATALAPLTATGHLNIVTSFNYDTDLYEAFVPNLPGNVLTEIRPHSVLFINLTAPHTVVVSGVSFPIRANSPTPVPVGASVTITVQQ